MQKKSADDLAKLRCGQGSKLKEQVYVALLTTVTTRMWVFTTGDTRILYDIHTSVEGTGTDRHMHMYQELN